MAQRELKRAVGDDDDEVELPPAVLPSQDVHDRALDPGARKPRFIKMLDIELSRTHGH